MRLILAPPERYAQLEPATLLQTWHWGRFKERFGWQSHYFELQPEHSAPLPLLVLSRPLAHTALRLAYVPHGPPVDIKATATIRTHIQLLENLSTQLRPVLPSSTILIRWDTLYDHQEIAHLESSRLYPAVMSIQPPDTTVVALNHTNEQLLAAMHAKTRYNIRLAERKGVVVRQAPVTELPQWYALYQETAQRDKIAIHSFEYYSTLFEVMNNTTVGMPPQLIILFAEAEHKLLAGIIVALWNRTATYLYGASSNTHRNWMAGYLVQWQAIQLAREQGCHSYDLYGIPPQRDPKHAMAGLYRFKVGFGGAIVHRAGAWDWHYRPLMAQLLRMGERSYHWYHTTMKRR